MRIIQRFNLADRLVIPVLSGTILVLALYLNLALADENHTSVTATLSGNWVNHGSVTTTNNAAHGMEATGNKTAVNAAQGTITTNGERAYGILASDNSTGTNSGTITTNGQSGSGIYAEQNSSVTNSGSVTTNGEWGVGITAYYNSTVANSGYIITQGERATGIFVVGGDGFSAAGHSTAVNSGSVTTYGDFAWGCYASLNGSVTSSGSVTTHGERATGMLAEKNSSVTNSGSVTTFGTEAHGIRVGTDGHSTATNSGVIGAYGTNSHAVLADATSVVVLETGTQILAGDVYSADVSNRLDLAGSGIADFDITGNWGQIHKTRAGTWTLAKNLAVSNDLFLDSGTLALAPGVLLAVGGNYTQAPGTRLVIAVDSSNAVSVTVAATAAIAGTLEVELSGTALGHDQVLLNATGGITGSYTAVASTNPHFSFTTTTATQVLLTAPAFTPQWDNSALGLTVVMGACHQAFMGVPGHRTAGLLAQKSQQPQEVLVASAGPLTGIMGKYQEDKPNGIYIQPLYSYSRRDPFASAPGYKAEMKGLEIGADTLVTKNFLAGVFAGYAANSIDFNGLAFVGNDVEGQQMYTLGGYGGYRLGNWMVSDILSVTHTDHNSLRNAGLNQTARANYDSQMLGSRLLASYTCPRVFGWEVVPELGLNAIYLNRDSFSETGAVNAVRTDNFSEFFVESVAGVRLLGSYQYGEIALAPYLCLAWARDLGGNDITTRQYLAATSAQITQKNDDNRLDADLGIALKKGDTTFTLAYAGSFSEHGESGSLTANLRLAF
ncbi:MAG: autotransporter domain-containing protein [Nanoarchaeota archaeon]|nr:autotransporter domain-containing protein [Nanoarchaeota archaeon]